MLSFYENSGYLSIPAVLGYGQKFNYIWGGRGTGKTYGALKYCIEHKKIFAYMRSLQTQIDMIKIPELSPFKKLNHDLGWSIYPKSVGKNIAVYYNAEIDENGKIKYTGNILGYAIALNTFANLRGFDASDVEIGIYDEFIPEKRERRVENAGYAFKNAYETMNRNRELEGINPIQFLLFSNSESLSCDMFIENGLMEKVSNMDINKQSLSIIRDRGIGLFNLYDSPISEKKKDTALYKMSGSDSAFNRMALGNEFYSVDYSGIKSMNIKELIPLCKMDAITIYQHKRKDLIYVTRHSSGTPPAYSNTDKDVKAFRRDFIYLWDMYLSNKVMFEDITSKSLFEIYFKNKY